MEHKLQGPVLPYSLNSNLLRNARDPFFVGARLDTCVISSSYIASALLPALFKRVLCAPNVSTGPVPATRAVLSESGSRSLSEQNCIVSDAGTSKRLLVSCSLNLRPQIRVSSS